jgi:hypothetical protein
MEEMILLFFYSKVLFQVERHLLDGLKVYGIWSGDEWLKSGPMNTKTTFLEEKKTYPCGLWLMLDLEHVMEEKRPKVFQEIFGSLSGLRTSEIVDSNV